MLVKKELAQIPVLPIPRGSAKKHCAAAAKEYEFPRSGKILAVDFFCDKNLALRFFSDGKNYIVTEEWPEAHWSTKSPQSFMLYGHFYSTKKQEKLVQQFLNVGSNYSYNPSIFHLVHDFIMEIQWNKRIAAEERKEQRRKAHLSLYPALPEHLDDYCEREVFQFNYIFIEKLNQNGLHPAVCGHCGEHFLVERSARSGQITICPKCGKTAKYKRINPHSIVTDQAKLCISHRVDGNLLLRWVDVVRSVSPESTMKYYFDDYAYHLRLGENPDQWHFYKWRKPMYSYEYKWYHSTNTYCYDSSYIYVDNLDDVFGSSYQNVNLKGGLSGRYAQFNFDLFLRNLQNNPVRQYLFQLGMINLATSELSLAINKDCPKITFQNIMGVSGQFLPMYRELDVTPWEHEVIREYGKWISKEDLLAYRSLKIAPFYFSTVKELLCTMSFRKFVNYFVKQLRVTKKPIAKILIEYRDYLSMSSDLKVDVSHKSVRFPENCCDAHALILGQYNKVRQQIENEKFQVAIAPLYEKFPFTEYEKGKYCVRLPKLRSDLLTEGQSLNHCVGRAGYAEQHMQGTRMIFFIRLASKPDVPFFTMELDMSNYRILQLYGFGDCSAPQAVRNFAEQFVKQFKAGILRKAG